MDRRQTLKALGGLTTTGLLAGCVGGDTGSNGEGYPEEDLSLIIPFSTGGGFDTYSRTLARYLPEHLPNQVDVRPTNVTGAGGDVAMEQLYDEEPDGHTFGIAHIPSFVLNQVNRNVDYDLQEMTWLPQIDLSRTIVSVGSQTDIHTWDDWVERADAGEMSYATVGREDITLATMAAVGHETGLYSAESLYENAVSYDGASDALQGLIRGDADTRAGSYESHLPFEEAGDTRIMMIFTPEPQPDLEERHPDADTLQGVGLEGVSGIAGLSGTGRIFCGPPDVPDDRAQVLRDAITETIQSDELQQDLSEADRPIVYASSEDTEQRVQDAFDSTDVFQEVLDIAEETMD